MTLPESGSTAESIPLKLCQHFEMLGASAVLQAVPDRVDLIECSVCGLVFQVKSEGAHLMVVRVYPVTPGK